MISARTVGFLDILGFRKLVESESAADLGMRFTAIVGRSLPTLNRKFHGFPTEPTLFPQDSQGMARCIMHAFSDSIILISKDDSENSSLALLVSAWRMAQTLIGTKLPVRGAIAHGDMYVDADNSLFLGKALTRAYELEQRQNWIGVAIDESVPDAFPNLLISDLPFPGLRSSLFPQYEVPMKTGPIRSLHTLNWRFNMVHEEGTKALFDDEGNWAARAKIQAALEYALEMRRSGRAYPFDQLALPIEVRSVFFAKTPPGEEVPNHGDEY